MFAKEREMNRRATALRAAHHRRTRRIRRVCIVAIILCLIAFALLAGFYFGYQAGFSDGRISRIPAADTLINTATEMPEGVPL